MIRFIPRLNFGHYWWLAGFCMRHQHCPEIVGPAAYYALSDWRQDTVAEYRASDDGMPEPLTC